MLRCLPWLSCAARCLSTEPDGAKQDPVSQSHVVRHIETLVETGQAVAIGLEDGTSEEDLGHRALQVADIPEDHSGLFSFVESCRQSMLVPVTPSGPPEGSPWDSQPHLPPVEQLPTGAAVDASHGCLVCNQMQSNQQHLLGLMASVTQLQQPPSPGQPTPLHDSHSVPLAATNATAQPQLTASSHRPCHQHRPASTPSGIRRLSRGVYVQGPRCSHDLQHGHARHDTRPVSIAINTLASHRTTPGAAGTMSDCATGTSCMAATGSSATLMASGYPSAAFGYDLGNSTRSTNSNAAAAAHAFRTPTAAASPGATTTSISLATGPGQPHASSHGCTTQPAPLPESYSRLCSSTLCGLPRGALSGRASPTLPPSLPARSTTSDGMVPQSLAQPNTPPVQRRYLTAKYMTTPTGAGEGRKRALSSLHPVPAAAAATTSGAEAYTCPGARGPASMFTGQQATHRSAAVAGSAPHAWLLAQGSNGGNSGCDSTPRGSVIGTGTCPGAPDPATWSPARLAVGLGSSLGSSVQSSPLLRQRQPQLVLLRAPPPVEVVGSLEQLLDGLVDLAALQPTGRRGVKGAASMVISGTWHGTTRVAVKLLQRDASWADGCPARAASLRAAQLCHCNLVQLFAVRLLYDDSYNGIRSSGCCASASMRSSVSQTGPGPNRNSSSTGAARAGAAAGLPYAPSNPVQAVQVDGGAFTTPLVGKPMRSSSTGRSAADTPKTARLLRAPVAGPAASPSVPEECTAVVPVDAPVPPRPEERVYVGTGWHVALIMEHCDRGDLGSLCCSPASPFMPRHGWPLRAAQRALLATAREVAAALAAVHAAGAAHGGLQPANVLLATCHSDARGFTAKVADVGAAASLHGAPQPARPHPAMLFAAPEALTAPPPAQRQQGAGEVAAGQEGQQAHPPPPLLTPAADVYSYGMLLYTMAAGRTPFQGMHLVSALMGVASEGLRPEWPTGQHASCLAQLYGRCTRQRPEERPTFNKILRDLQHCEDLLATAVLYGSAWT